MTQGHDENTLEIEGCLCAGTGGLGAPRPLPFSSPSSCPKCYQHLSELHGARTGRSDEWTEGAEGDTVTGSCQSRMSNGIFKTQRLFRKDTGASSAWQRDMQRGDNIPREQSQQESRPSWLAAAA